MMFGVLNVVYAHEGTVSPPGLRDDLLYRSLSIGGIDQEALKLDIDFGGQQYGWFLLFFINPEDGSTVIGGWREEFSDTLLGGFDCTAPDNGHTCSLIATASNHGLPHPKVSFVGREGGAFYIRHLVVENAHVQRQCSTPGYACDALKEKTTHYLVDDVHAGQGVFFVSIGDQLMRPLGAPFG
eukprot:Trichotokara_eunicae@DN8305_c0_g1_i1.p1